MNKINAYLTFSGNCREAMVYYKKCLGGKLTLQTIGESPLAEKMPKQMQQAILHAHLTAHDFVLLGSDMVPEKGLAKGNAISLMLNCNTEKTMRNYFQKLSEGGKVLHPIEFTFWGALLGDLTDKFGNNWLLHFNKNKINKFS